MNCHPRTLRPLLLSLPLGRPAVHALVIASLLLLFGRSAWSQSELYIVHGDAAGDVFGWSVADAGDVNNDGWGDVIVGIPWDDDHGSMSGSARVISGADGSTLYTVHGAWEEDLFGWSVAGAGNVDGDAHDDFIVGAPENDGSGWNAGAAVVFSGIDGSVIYTLEGDSWGDRFGWSVSGAGDVNGDGRDDLIVGAPEDDNNDLLNSGSARVYSGATGNPLFTRNGTSEEDYFGISVSGAGDVTGDGMADVVVGAYWADHNGEHAGSVRVYRGPNGIIEHTFFGDDAHDWFGESVSGAGDVNDDGHDDIIVGARYDDNNGDASGSAKVFSGDTGALLYSFLGDSPGDWFGRSVGGVGDLDGDGHDDLIVGADQDDNNGVDSGSLRLLSGRTGEIFYTVSGEDPGDALGFAVSRGGDVNGDGIPDFVGGAPRDDDNGGSAGSVLILGGPRPPGALFCFGDPGLGTPCPCTNDNDGSVPGSGCANGAFDSGAQLTGTGSASVGGDTLVLRSTGLEPNNSGLYFQAKNKLSGSVWGDGLQCAGGGLIRLQVRASNGDGESHTTLSIASKGNVNAGDIRYYQCWYRTTDEPPCGLGVNDFNATNGYSVFWLP